MVNYEFNYNITEEEDESIPQVPAAPSSTLVDILNGSVLIRPPEVRDPFLASLDGSAILHFLNVSPEFIQDDRFTVPTEADYNARNEQFTLAA